MRLVNFEVGFEGITMCGSYKAGMLQAMLLEINWGQIKVNSIHIALPCSTFNVQLQWQKENANLCLSMLAHVVGLFYVKKLLSDISLEHTSQLVSKSPMQWHTWILLTISQAMSQAMILMILGTLEDLILSLQMPMSWISMSYLLSMSLTTSLMHHMSTSLSMSLMHHMSTSPRIPGQVVVRATAGRVARTSRRARTSRGSEGLVYYEIIDYIINTPSRGSEEERMGIPCWWRYI